MAKFPPLPAMLRARSMAATVATEAGAVHALGGMWLKKPVSFAKTGGAANLSVNAATGAISAAVALGEGEAQTISGTATGADGVSLPWSMTLTGAAPLPQLGPMIANFSVGAAAGDLIADITGVPAGSVPTFSPADGRVIVAGDEATGWKLVRGLSAVTVGAIMGTISAPGAISVDITISIGAGYDYLIANDADFAAIPEALKTDGGGIAFAAGATLTGAVFDMEPGATLRFFALDPANKPKIDRATLRGCNNLLIEDVDFITSEWSTTPAPAILWDKNAGGIGVRNLVMRRCDRLGNYRGVVDYALDPTSNIYAELASILPVFDDSGAVAGFTVPNAYVGDLLENGSHDMIFNSVSGFVTFSIDPVAHFAVVDGYITSTTLVSGGTSDATSARNTNTGGLSNLVKWAGKQYMSSYLAYGDKGTGLNVISGPVTIEDCTWRLLGNGFKLDLGPDTALINNIFDMMYQDAFSCSFSSDDTKLNLSHNIMTRFWNKTGDPGDPHGDAIQLFMYGGGLTTAATDICMIGNIVFEGLARGSSQGIFVTDEQPGLGWGGVYVGNVILNQGQGNTLSVSRTNRAYIMDNIALRYSTAEIGNGRSIGPYMAEGRTLVGKNITESVIITSPAIVPDTHSYPNTQLGNGGSIIPYTTIFPNFENPAPTGSVPEILARIARAPAYAAALIDGVDHLARTIDLTKYPYWVEFNKPFDQAQNIVIASDWSPLLGPPGVIEFTCTNGLVQIADDAAGTNATEAVASGSFTATAWNQKYIRVINHMTASSGSAAASSIVTLNDASYNFDSITASTASFALVDNGGVAWSKFSPPAANLAGFNKLLIATTIREDVYAALMTYAASSNTAYLQIGQRSASQFRVTGLGTTAKFTGVVGATEKKVLISLDFSKTELSDQMMCFSDGVRAALDSSSSSNHLTGDYIFSSNDAFGNSTIPFGLFAAGGGSRITNAAMGFFWMDFYTPEEAMPDIRDPDVRAAFSADRLGADGSSDLFGQPLWYYQGTAADWNAGMANKGSLIAPLTVGAGGFA